MKAGKKHNVTHTTVRSSFQLFKYICRGRGKRRRSNWKTIKSFFVCLIVGCCFLFIILITHSSRNNMSENEEMTIDLSNNYFQPYDKVTNSSFLVDTHKCRIPDVDIWDAGIRPLVGPPSKFKCAETYMRLTYVQKDVVIINEEALKSIGYMLDQITCCYYTIKREEQNKSSSNHNADNLFRYSSECLKMERVTKPKSSFIKVACTAKGFFESFFKYTNFHMIAMFPDESSSLLNSNITKKLAWWEDCLSVGGSLQANKTCERFREYGRPPNILVLGWDSTSRGNFHRFMHKTNDILENLLKPVEMVGYNKVGENTFPNFVPLMSSLSTKELVQECFANNSVPQDDCPYIWKKFSDHHYLTAHLEDAPTIAIFNYLKTGFIKPPVDIYPRPFMLAAYEEKGGGEDLIDCIGYQRPEEMILNYIVDLAELAESRKIPYFLTTWLTDLTHYDMNNLQLADTLMAMTLKNLYKKGLLENTVLFIMSDHGYRFLEVRTTTAGWFEDKLPTLWIKLPPSVSKVHWTWLDYLHSNARSLVTPFDIHESFHQLLNAYWDPASEEDNKKASSIRGVSPFKKLPIRSCDEAGIPTEYCACIPPTACRFNSTLIKLAAEKVVQSINTNLPAECTPLKVATVTACGTIKESGGGKVDFSGDKLADSNESGGESGEIGSSDVVVVALQTKPGNFLFEALVHYNKTTKQFTRVSKLSRMNKKTTSSACLVKKDSWMELLCYCDSFSIFNTFAKIITS